jgi:hypothetical protein
MSERDAFQYAREVGLRKPELQQHIQDLWQLMCCEIESGESETHEAQKFITSVKELDEAER